MYASPSYQDLHTRHKLSGLMFFLSTVSMLAFYLLHSNSVLNISNKALLSRFVNRSIRILGSTVCSLECSTPSIRLSVLTLHLSSIHAVLQTLSRPRITSSEPHPESSLIYGNSPPYTWSPRLTVC